MTGLRAQGLARVAELARARTIRAIPGWQPLSLLVADWIIGASLGGSSGRVMAIHGDCLLVDPWTTH